MHVLFLVAIMVALGLAQGLPREAPPWMVAAVLCAYLVVAAGLTRLNTSLFLRLLSRGGQLAQGALRRHNILAMCTRFWLIGGLGAVVVCGYGRWVMHESSLNTVPLAAKAVILAPFVAAILLTWVMDYPFHRELRRRVVEQHAMAGRILQPPWTLRQYLGYNTRHYLLFVAVPVGIIFLLTDVLDLYVGPLLPERVAAPIVEAAGIAMAGAVFLIAPVMIVRILRTRPLDQGRTRSELEAMAERMNLRFRQILIWRSGGVIANAAVMGVVAPVRYVLLSDALLEQMDPSGVKAIFAHEASHAAEHHIAYGALFLLVSVLLSVTLGGGLAAIAELGPHTQMFIPIFFLAGAWSTGFGWLSRRLERQCDVAAAWASGPAGHGDSGDLITPEGAAIYARALQQVAQLNGIAVTQRNWRHGSIAARISYVLWLGGSRGTRTGIDRLVRRIKLALWAGLAVAVAATAALAVQAHWAA